MQDSISTTPPTTSIINGTNATDGRRSTRIRPGLTIVPPAASPMPVVNGLTAEEEEFLWERGLPGGRAPARAVKTDELTTEEEGFLAEMGLLGDRAAGNVEEHCWFPGRDGFEQYYAAFYACTTAEEWDAESKEGGEGCGQGSGEGERALGRKKVGEEVFYDSGEDADDEWEPSLEDESEDSEEEGGDSLDGDSEVSDEEGGVSLGKEDVMDESSETSDEGGGVLLRREKTIGEDSEEVGEAGGVLLRKEEMEDKDSWDSDELGGVLLGEAVVLGEGNTCGEDTRDSDEQGGVLLV